MPHSFLRSEGYIPAGTVAKKNELTMEERGMHTYFEVTNMGILDKLGTKFSVCFFNEGLLESIG